MKSKKEIRKEIKENLKKQKISTRIEKSLLIKEKLFALSEFKKANTIMLYTSTDFEVDTNSIIDEALKAGKRVAVPYVLKEGKRMVPSLIKNRTSDLSPGPYGIYQPTEKSFMECPCSEIDLVVVPGIAFTKGGARLGRGAGYYDRFLSGLSKKTRTVGIAFTEQIVPVLPQTQNDIPVQMLITG